MRPPPPNPPPPPPPNLPRYAHSAPKSKDFVWRSYPRLIIAALTLLGLFFIFRVVKELGSGDESTSVHQSANDVQSNSGSVSDSSPTSGGAEDTVAISGDTTASYSNAPPVEQYESALTAIEKGLFGYRKAPDLSVYTRIENNLKVLLDTLITVHNYHAKDSTNIIDRDMLLAFIKSSDDLDTYRSSIIASYSLFASDISSKTREYIDPGYLSNNDQFVSAILSRKPNNHLGTTRDSALILCANMINLGLHHSRGNSEHWHSLDTRLDALSRSQDHILRNIEQVHALFVDVLLQLVREQDASSNFNTKLQSVINRHRDLLSSADNRYDRIAAHTDSIAALAINWARLLPSNY